jgi:phosphoserine aminotransferase
MTEKRIYNFNPGPATLPLPVLEEIQKELLNYKGSGMSVMEISHRSSWFEDIIEDAVGRAKRLLNLDDRFTILFIQGGASLQFAMIPMNFLPEGKSADYVNTGTWSTKAIKEAEIQKKPHNVVASSEDRDFAYIPKNIQFNKDAAFAHITSNNTIKGTQFHEFPDTGGVPIISDMSSDIFSRALDIDKFGMIYAGAQKNIGPSGICMVIIRDDMFKLIPEGLPSMLDYSTFLKKKSLYNTPPTFSIYTVQLVLKWIEETVGGMAAMEKQNQEKAALLYNCIDESEFYRGTADKDSRSLMNVTFRLPSEDLEKKFIEEATNNGLGGLKGHRSVGGCRASIYNAMPVEGLKALTDFMAKFEKENS